MPSPTCTIQGCIHLPGFVIVCDGGYDLDLALASVGPGWSDLVREAFTVVEGKTSIEQVKEKFGGLRIYPGVVHEDESEQVFNALQDIENRSYKMCEQCGSPGKPNDKGWIKTLCGTHHEERENRYA